jgi:hypothetical protein
MENSFGSDVSSRCEFTSKFNFPILIVTDQKAYRRENKKTAGDHWITRREFSICNSRISDNAFA